MQATGWVAAAWFASRTRAAAGSLQVITPEPGVGAEPERPRFDEPQIARAIVAALTEAYAFTIDGEIVAANDALSAMLACTRDELIGLRPPYPFWPPEIAQLDDHDGDPFELELTRKSGDRFLAELTARPARNDDGSVLGYLTTFRDLAELKLRLAEQGSTDAITGLANDRSFHERLRAEVTRARRYRRSLSVVLLDLDHFEQVNETHGHDAGDRVLEEFGRRLASEARQGETVARLGGEEFAWLLPETDKHGAYQAAERIRRAIESEPFAAAGTLTVSAGVCASEDDLDPEKLVRFAERALYWAKDGGRNTTFLYTAEAHALLTRETQTVERFQALSSVRALARAIDSKDSSTSHHSERVAQLAERIALELGWTANQARLLHACGLLHDVGKIGVPDELLLKPGALTEEEYEQVKPHAELSARIASEVLAAEQVRWIRGHHERWDGTGYPDRLSHDEISNGAQILSVADAYDVMTESDIYRQRRSPSDALAEITALAGRQFAPEAVRGLAAVLSRVETASD